MTDSRDKVVDIAAQVEARRRQEAEELAAAKKDEPKSQAGGPDDPKFVRECLDHNERGDGILYASLHSGKFIYNKTSGKWLCFNGHHWEDDLFDRAVDCVEAVALRYLAAADALVDQIAEARDKLDAANVKVSAANKMSKILAKSGSSEEQGNCDREGKAAAEEAALAASQLKKLMGLRKKYLTRVDRCRGKAGVERTLFFAHIAGRLHLRSEDLDQHPMLLPCQNGVIDLETGRLIAGVPEQYLLRAIPVPFNGVDRTNPDFRPFLFDIYRNDQDIVEFVLRLLGYCLTGLRIEHFIACFIGRGRNGKGTLFEIMHDLLGALAWAIDPEMLMETRTPPNASSHSAHLASLKGRRLCIGAETEENRRISGAAVKRLTGGDIIKTRAPNDREEINFRPTHKLVLHTNDLPSGLTKDFALRERLIIVDHPMLYVDNPEQRAAEKPHLAERFRAKDRTLPQRLRANLPGILAEIVRYCLLWQREGLNPPEKIRAATEETYRSEDHLGRFLDEVVHKDPGGKTGFTYFYDRYKDWYADTVDEKCKYIQTKRTVGKELRERGYILPDPKETAGKLWILDIYLPQAAL